MNDQEFTPEEIEDQMKKQQFVRRYDNVLFSLCSLDGLLVLLSAVVSKESERSICAINDWLDANRETYKKYKEEIR